MGRLPRSWGRAGVILALSTPPALAQAQAPRPGDPSAVEVARLYADACAPCHGRVGDGRGRAARLLGAPQPRDFTAGVYKFRSTSTGSLPTDADLHRIVSRGVPGTWMPGWENLLTPAERWALVRYIKGFSELFSLDEPEPPIEIPPPPDPTPALVQEGRFVYAMLGCAECHGPRGRGDGPSAAELTDDWGRPTRPYDLTRGVYRNGSAPADLYRTLVTGLSGTPMPAYEPDVLAFPGGRDADIPVGRETLTSEELRALQAYLHDQPTAVQLAGMSEEQRERLRQGRLWALVYYLRSLERPVGVLRWLFGQDPELGARREGRER